MPDYSVGFFLVPAAYLDKLRALEETHANLPMNVSVHESYFHSNQIFLRARELALVSEEVGGSLHPLSNDGRVISFIRLNSWLGDVLLKGHTRRVLDVEHSDRLIRALGASSLEEFLAWNDRVDLMGPADHALLTELFTALERVLQARPAELHGLVYCDLTEEYRDPPPPEPEPPEPTISRADAARRTKMLDFSIQAEINRQRRPWWPGAPDQEGRALLGLVAPEQVPPLAEAYRQAIEMLGGDEVIAGLAALREEVIPRIEAALIEPVIETLGAPVQALYLLRFRLERVSGEEPPAVCSPEQAVTLEAQLDQYIDDEAIEWIWGLERHWTREQVRETYQRLRELLGRAIATGHGFVWLIDFHQL